MRIVIANELVQQFSSLKYLSDNPLFNEEELKHEQMSSKSWMDDSDLKKGTVAVLDNDEKLFWEEFIPKYLKPLDTNKEHENQVFVFVDVFY